MCQRSPRRLGVVTPMANEERRGVEFVDAVLAVCSTSDFSDVTMVVVVDRASRDGTRERLERHAQTEPRLRVVWAPETRGVADAYIRGYREALALECEWVLEIDAGFSHDPEQIGAFLGAIPTGVDCAFGTRFAPGARNAASWQRRTISRAGTVLTNALLGTRLSDMTSGFELFSREALESALRAGIHSKGPFFQTELKVHCRRLPAAEIPITYTTDGHKVSAAAVRESLFMLGRLAWSRARGSL